jgi:glycosyltransferase involved in cell wall biosynthesis
LKPLISIIVPVYNKEKYILETIQSVLNQTYDNWELLFIDDGSSDNSCEIVKSVQDHRIFLQINTENRGANYCRNYGLSIAKGDYVIFLDADDLLLAHCLKNRVFEIEKNEFDCCVFTLGTFYHKIGDSNHLWIPNSNQPLIDFLQHVLPWQTMQPIWKKEFLNKIGGFDISFIRLQDVEMHTRALLVSDFKIKLVRGNPDCFFRIDEQRKNFKQFVFLQKWISAAIQYYNKFYALLPNKKQKRYLLGTIYKTYLQLFYSFKAKTISKAEFDNLYKTMNAWISQQDFGFKVNLCFKIAYYLNLFPLKIPGVNLIISKIIVQ